MSLRVPINTDKCLEGSDRLCNLHTCLTLMASGIFWAPYPRSRRSDLSSPVPGARASGRGSGMHLLSAGGWPRQGRHAAARSVVCSGCAPAMLRALHASKVYRARLLCLPAEPSPGPLPGVPATRPVTLSASPPPPAGHQVLPSAPPARSGPQRASPPGLLGAGPPLLPHRAVPPGPACLPPPSWVPHSVTPRGLAVPGRPCSHGRCSTACGLP